MGAPENFHLNFQSQGKNFDLKISKEWDTNHKININGVSYSVLGDESILDAACDILNSVSLYSILNENDLKTRLSSLKDISFPVSQKIEEIGTKTLNTAISEKKEQHIWKDAGEARLPVKREWLAKTYWSEKENKGGHESIKGFLGKEFEEQFDKAIHDDDLQSFIHIFDDFTEEDIENTYRSENLFPPLGFLKTESYEITEKDLQNLKTYLDDVGFSGVVSISDEKKSYTVCPTGLESLKNVPFSMHSIGKVFTGVAALLTFPEEAFDKSLELSPSVIEALPKKIKEHLSNPTLHETMQHLGRFGDFLGNYEKAIQDALINKTPLPEVAKPEDFLRYADNTLQPDDNRSHYSNLGILLVALAVEHHAKKPFDDVIRELILEPAKGINISTTKPANGRFNAEDPCQGLIVGGPSGGYYTTADQLEKLGRWLKEKCIEDKAFFNILNKYGTEFYRREDKEIWHNGCSGSGSALLASSLDSGITVAILSDQSNFMADKIYNAIRENLMEKED